jgi:hypothetical protein
LPGPQTQTYDSLADVIGFGGSAGGGKSQLIIGLASCEHQHSLILRRESTQVRALIDEAVKIFGDTGSLNRNTGIWTGLPGGRQIEFGGVANPGDEQKYRGRPHDFLAFDEADHFSEQTVRFLSAWCRTTTPGQRCRVVLTFNPPASAEGRWLLSYLGPWLDRKHPRPARPGELRWYATLPDGKETECPNGETIQAGSETITPKSRTFIPSRVTDNPFLMATGYVSQLQALPEPLRSQLLFGDMAAGLQDDPWQVIPTAWIEAAMARWKPTPPEGCPLTALGVDVAYGGDDKTVLARRVRTWFAKLEKHPGRSTPDGQATAGLILKAVSGGDVRDRLALVNIDAIGYGASAYDQVKGNLPNVKAIVASAATNRMDRAKVLHFANLRAYAHWSLREALDPKTGDNLMLPPDPELLADLAAPRWEMRSSGIIIEDKNEIKERIGRSPDCGESVILANLQMAIPSSPPTAFGGGPKVGSPMPRLG